jgi:hypothetical protein
MTDYFDTAFYVNLSVGKWDKPYEFKGAKWKTWQIWKMCYYISRLKMRERLWII